MRIVVAARCYNESRNIDRFMRGYDFADEIVVSDGGSRDDSVSKLQKYKKVHLFHYEEFEVVNGQRWNPDSGHMNFVLNLAKTFEPDWLIFDDMDCVPNSHLRENARNLFSIAQFDYNQINAFRLYLWGETKFFPEMNKNFHSDYKSLWAWRPKEINIYADPNVRHGTLVNVQSNYYGLDIPYCLLHKSWNPKTVDRKIKRYNALGLPMNHPLQFAGEPMPLPEWGYE